MLVHKNTRLSMLLIQLDKAFKNRITENRNPQEPESGLQEQGRSLLPFCAVLRNALYSRKEKIYHIARGWRLAYRDGMAFPIHCWLLFLAVRR